jgi:Icc-related predicted phosphoesterase
LNEHLTRIVASCEPRGQIYEVEWLLEAARKDGAQALALLGDLGAGEEVREYAKVLRTVGQKAGMPAFYVPGPGDVPFGAYLREAHNTEVVFPSMHGVHGTFAFADGYHLVFAGMGGEVADDTLHEREERERLSYPGWEVEYRLKILREMKDYQKVFLFYTPPTHKGLHEGGSDILAELVKTYSPRLVLTGGVFFRQEYLGTSLVVAPGSLSEGGYAFVDLHERQAEERRL